MSSSAKTDASASKGSSTTAFGEMTKLDLTKLKLYGRSKELDKLREVYDKVSSSDVSSQAVFVCGTSGTGKSTLVDKFCRGLSSSKNKKKPLYVSGKFNQFGAGKPYSALASALNDLCDQLLAADNTDATETIQNAVGSEGEVLKDVIPRLGHLIGHDELPTDSEKVATVEALNQLVHVFKSFIRAVASMKPLVLFMDDLQWADESSLKLIRAMLMDSKSKNLLFIGAYRDDDEISERLADTMTEVKEHKTIHSIKIDNFDVDTVNTMLSDLTKLDRTKTLPLAELVHHRTNGNAFFLLQFLDLLVEENLLVYSIVSFQWTWNLDDIREKTNVSDNVVELVAVKLQRMEERVQFVLKIAACLWSTFDVNFLVPVLEQLHKEDEICVCCDKEEVIGALDVAVQEGLVEKQSELRYRFVHDRIQMGAYSLIPQGHKRDLIHLRIGEIVLKLSEQSKVSQEWMAFIASHQLNRGSSCITDFKKKLELAELNLEVAIMAISLSAFVPAAEYLQSGIDILLASQKDPWEQQYQLNLQLHNKSARMELCCGNLEQCKVVANTVLKRGKCTRDKLPSYFVLMDCLLHSERKFQEATEIGLSVLDLLGEGFPKRAHSWRTVVDLVKTKRMLKNMREGDLDKLPVMKDGDKIAAMNVLNSLMICAFWAGESGFWAMVGVRMIQLTLQHGVTNLSSYAFCNYGILLCSLGDVKEAYRLGSFAIKVVERLKAKECKGRVLVLVYSFISPWQKPLHDSLEPLLQAHRVGMECGDIETGANAGSLYAQAYLFCGLPLAPIERDLRSYAELMREYNLGTTLEGNLPKWQMMLNLMGSADPLVLTGDVMNQEEFLRNNPNPASPNALGVWLKRLQLGYYFGDLDLALEMAQIFSRNCKTLRSHFLFYVFTFFEGLLYLELARSNKRKYKAEALKSIKRMRNWVKKGVVNCYHKLQLLEAECLSLTAKHDKVKAAYDFAIKSARRAGFVQDNALACERAGVFFLSHGDNYWASVYLSDAHKLYCEWGAHKKADHLQDRFRSVFSPSNLGYSSNVKGRQRYSSKFSTMHKRLSVEAIEKNSLEMKSSQDLQTTSVEVRVSSAM